MTGRAKSFRPMLTQLDDRAMPGSLLDALLASALLDPALSQLTTTATVEPNFEVATRPAVGPLATPTGAGPTDEPTTTTTPQDGRTPTPGRGAVFNLEGGADLLIAAPQVSESARSLLGAPDQHPATARGEDSGLVSVGGAKAGGFQFGGDTGTPIRSSHDVPAFLVAAPRTSDSPGELRFTGAYSEEDGDPANPAELRPIIDQADGEGQDVDLAVELMAPPPAGITPTFSVTNLPPGLSINTATGVITGRPTYVAAEQSGGGYDVTVTATVGSSSASSSFKWGIDETNRLGWIDDQLYRLGSRVLNGITLSNLIQVSGGMQSGWTLSASIASGQAATVDANQNIVCYVPNATATYDVTVTLTGGGDTDQRTFKLYTFTANANGVLPIVNGTLSPIDDIGLLGGPSVPVRFLTFGPAYAFASVDSFTVTGPGVLTGPPTTGTSGTYSCLEHIGNIEITGTSGPVSVTANLTTPSGLVSIGPVAISAVELKLKTGESLEFENKVRATTTPTGMPNRIPPRARTSGGVEMKGDLAAGQVLKAFVAGGSKDNGRANFANRLNIFLPITPVAGETGWELQFGAANANGVRLAYLALGMMGESQTTVGTGTKLSIEVRDGTGKAIKSSDTFGVAAVAKSVKMEKGQVLNPGVQLIQVGGNGNEWKWRGYFGHQYKMTVLSDSLVTADLDKVQFTEIIFNNVGAGFMQGIVVSASGYLPAVPAPGKVRLDTVAFDLVYEDAVNLPEAKLKAEVIESLFDNFPGAGSVKQDQIHLFKDARVGGGTAYTIVESGFRHELTVTAVNAQANPQMRTVTVIKEPKGPLTYTDPATIVAYTAQAGVAADSKAVTFTLTKP